jgi:hypothetical protein
MQASCEEILSVLRKWLNERSPVLVSFWFSSATGSLTGFVIKAAEDAIVVAEPKSDKDAAPDTLIAIPLAHALGFAFADPAEAISPEHRKALESEIESMVMIFLANRERIAISTLPN